MRLPSHAPIAVGLVLDMADKALVDGVRDRLAHDVVRLLEVAAGGGFAFIVIAGDPTRAGATRIVLVRDKSALMLAVGAGFDFIDAQAHSGATSAWMLSPSIEEIVRPMLTAMQATEGPMQ